MTRDKLSAWFFLMRPWSYTATLVPALFALALIHSEVVWDEKVIWWRWGAALVTGILLQAVVNLLNTWGDERNGVDSVPGAVRTTPQVQSGAMSLRSVLVAAMVCFALAALLGFVLCFYGRFDIILINKPLVVVAIIGALGATNYSTGIKFKYHALGVPFVFFLMGTIEILGFVFASSPYMYKPLIGRWILLSLPINALVAVIMHGNDMRDIPTDRKAGIKTLASVLGATGALLVYFILHLFPYVFILAMAILEQKVRFLLPLVVFPLTVGTLVKALSVYLAHSESPPWLGLERASGGIHFLFGLAYTLAVI